MSIVKIIMDKLPDGHYEEVITNEVEILLTTRNVNLNTFTSNFIQRNVPIVIEEDLCEWRLTWTRYHYKTSCKQYFDSDKKPEICPKCKKKIEYLDDKKVKYVETK